MNGSRHSRKPWLNRACASPTWRASALALLLPLALASCEDSTELTDTVPVFSGRVADQVYTVGTEVALALPSATGGEGRLTYTLQPRVPGLVFDINRRMLTGTPTAEGTYAMTYRVTDEDDNIGDDDADVLTFVVTIGNQVVQVVSGRLRASGATIVTAGRVYQDEAPVPDQRVVAIARGDDVYLYHTALGPVPLGEEMTRRTVGYLIANPGILTPSSVSVSATGLRVDRGDNQGPTFAFSNQTRRWHAVVSRPVGSPVFIGRTTQVDVPVDQSEIELYGSILALAIDPRAMVSKYREATGEGADDDVVRELAGLESVDLAKGVLTFILTEVVGESVPLVVCQSLTVGYR